jgi:hypothetical protein
MYIKSSIKYVRRNDLEGANLHLVKIHIKFNKTHRLVNVYRSFIPKNFASPKELFSYQMDQISKASTPNTIQIVNFVFKNYFEIMDQTCKEFNYTLLVRFEKWSRMVTNIYGSSIIDHIYTCDLCIIQKIANVTPLFGDLLMIVFNHSSTKEETQKSIKRSWRKYNKSVLSRNLLKSAGNQVMIQYKVIGTF